jgi:hypothetical protein
MSKNPPILRKTQKLTVTATPCEFDSQSSHCMLQVISGDLFVTGGEDPAVSAGKSFKIPENAIFEFTGRVKLVSDSTADVRILFYEYV